VIRGAGPSNNMNPASKPAVLTSSSQF
jgi:hypothetical protein